MLITLIAFLFVLAFSITIHEFGHFIAAKLFGISVEKFSIGFGPPLVRIKIGETDFRIAYFPLGGYVKMAGDDEGEFPALKKTEKPPAVSTAPVGETSPIMVTPEPSPAPGKERMGLYDAPIIKRITVVFSGPFFNILSAAALFIFVLLLYGIMVNPFLRVAAPPDSYASRIGFVEGDSIIAVAGATARSWDDVIEAVSRNEGKEMVFRLDRGGTVIEKGVMVNIDSFSLRPIVPPVLGYVKRDGPADKSGLKSGDIIIAIDGQKVKTWDELVEKIRASRNVPLRFEWQSGGELKNAEIIPLPYIDPLSNDTVGQISAMMPMTRQRVSLTHAASLGARRSGELLWLTLKTLWQLIIGKISRRALGGPIAIARLSGESARWGFENLLGLIGIISINLGLVNLFPLPAFDGGHIIMALVEGLRKKRFSQKTRLVIQQIGYAIILLIIIYVTFNDVTR